MLSTIYYLVYELDSYHEYIYNSTKYTVHISVHFEDILHYYRSIQDEPKKIALLISLFQLVTYGTILSWLAGAVSTENAPGFKFPFEQFNYLFTKYRMPLRAWERRSNLQIIEKINTRSEHSNRSKCLMVAKNISFSSMALRQKTSMCYVLTLIRSKHRIQNLNSKLHST